MYLTGSWQNATEPHLDAQRIGALNTPSTNKPIKRDWVWAADNGAFNHKTYVGDEAWFAWLSRQDPTGCLFATAPDVVGDHDATLARSLPWLDRIRSLGYPAAFVLQDGASIDTVPWDDFDVAFVGGTNAFKLGGADDLIREAQRRGKGVHVGRVNSGKRFERFTLMGVDSCDGTYLAFGPDLLLPNLLAWVRKASTHEPLWRLA